MNYRKAILIIAAIPLLGIPAGADHRDDDKPEHRFQARLRGRNEIPLTLSAGRGTLELTVDAMDTKVHFVLTYTGLQTAVGAAHIHVAQPFANGGVTVFFCGNVPAGFPARPACPQTQPATVEGDFTAADVIGLPTQQLEPNNLAKLLGAIRAGRTYANVHTATSGGGEIRGQIEPRKGRR
jgi:hypothetical protein